MHTNYQHPIMAQLRDQQVRFAPREKKLEQLDRSEQLLGELRPERIYTYEYLCFRITDFRPTSFAHSQISGESAAHDVRLLIEDLSDSANIPAESAGENVHTVNDLCDKYRVSAKTVTRWRQMGLVSRRFVFNGRKRVGFLDSSVQRFVKRNSGRVRRGMAFQRLTDEQREEIVSRARRMARAGAGVTDVADRLAKRMQRSSETVRATLRDFDRENPDMAIFPRPNTPLTDEAKARIYQQFRRGTDVEALAKMFSRTRSTIYRTVNEMRAQRIAELPLDYMPNPVFTRRNADKVCLGPMPEPDAPPRKVRRPSGLPPYLASLYENPLLNREQEAHIFRKFNYLKYKAAKLRKRLAARNPKLAVMEEIEQLYEEAVATKNEIVRANLRLVVSIAKRHVDQHENFFELVSDGNMSLLRAVEKFDFARGNKFSTYASWAIMKNFARTIPGEYKHRDRFRTSNDELFGATEELRVNHLEVEAAQAMREKQVNLILDRLDEREQRIIINRFGLDHSQEPQTLQEVGEVLGVTKERIRQIEARALSKLREAVQEEAIAIDFAEE